MAQRELSDEERHRSAFLVEYNGDVGAGRVTFSDERPVEVGKLQDQSRGQRLPW